VHSELTGLVNHGERKTNHGAREDPGGSHAAGGWLIPYSEAEEIEQDPEKANGKKSSDSGLTKWAEAHDWKYAEKSNHYGRVKSRTGPKEQAPYVKVWTSHVEDGSGNGSAGSGDGSNLK